MSETEAQEPTSGLMEDGKPIDGGLLSGVMDLIAEEYAPKTDTFPVTILLAGQSVVFRFKRLKDGKDMDELQKRAVAWAQSLMPRKVMKNVKISPMAPALKEWFVPDPVVLAKVYVVTQLATHPDFQSEAMVMRLYRQAWPIFNAVVAQIDLGATNQIGASEKADYETEKKDSTPTPATA